MKISAIFWILCFNLSTTQYDTYGPRIRESLYICTVKMSSDKTLLFSVESYKYAALSFAIMSLKLMINHQKVQPKDNYMVSTLR